MRLSTAIRVGSLLHPQVFGSRETWSFFKHRKRTCALAAALEAATLSSHDIPEEEWITERGHRVKGTSATFVPADWGYFDFVSCPGCTERSGERHRIIAHLNDDHRWTRERIADWIEQWERSAETPAEHEMETVARS